MNKIMDKLNEIEYGWLDKNNKKQSRRCWDQVEL